MAEKLCTLIQNEGRYNSSYQIITVSWLNLTTIKYKKYGNVVTILIPTQTLKCTTANTDYWSSVIIPEGYRPPDNIYFPIYSGGYGGISSGGQILFHPTLTDTWVQLTMTYIV